MIAKIAALCTVAVACAAAPAARASTFTVRSTDDSGTGSLRDAVNSANADPSPPATIVFAPGVTGVIDLLSPLSLSQSATILGPGASSLELDGNGGQTQILSISSPATVSISGLRFAFGAAPAKGGAIANSGTLSVSGARFDHNTAGGAGSAAEGQGGAIYNSGALTVSDSTFAENTAGGAGGSTNCSGCGLGGAIDNATSGAATVTGSTFTGNTAGGDGGSGIDSGDGGGGAIASVPNSTLTVTDSTLTDNSAGGAAGAGGQSGVGSGGAIGVGAGATGTLRSDTIDANSVGSASGSAGAGIDNVEATVTIAGTIVSGNTGAGNCTADLGSTTSVTDSIEGPAGQTSCGFDLPSADPGLRALAYNGGPTQTQALDAGSQAIGAVASASDCPARDQRGARRPLGGCDVGAYEVAPPVISGSNATGLATTAASLAATVANPDVQGGTVAFQYGTSSAYGTTTSSQALPAGASATAFGASLTGLSTGTTYHFRVIATNPDGATFGPDQQFTTASPPVPPAPSAPSNAFTFGNAKVGPHGAINLPVSAPGAGTFTAKATFTVITHNGRKRVKTTFTYGTARVQSTSRGTFKLVIGLATRAARELKQLGSRQVTIAVTFTPTGGTARHATKILTVRRSRKGKYS